MIRFIISLTCVAVTAMPSGAQLLSKQEIASGAELLAMTDIDGDGDADCYLVKDNQGVNKWLMWAEQIAPGQFAAPTLISGNEFGDLVAGDVNGDGFGDAIFSVYSQPGSIVTNLLLSQGGGVFSESQVDTGGPTMPALSDKVLTDLDLDGDVELLGRQGLQLVAHEWGVAGAFLPAKVLATGLSRIFEVAHTGGPGYPVVLAANLQSDILLLQIAPGLTVEPAKTVRQTVWNLSDASSGDLNADGELDVVYSWGDPSAAVARILSDGQGGFGPDEIVCSASASGYHVEVIELDGAAPPEVVTHWAWDGYIRAFRYYEGVGYVEEVSWGLSVPKPSHFMCLHDVNGDGLSDVVVGGSGAYWMQCEPADCNGSGQADALELQLGIEADCNSNFIPDPCDIQGGTSYDVNLDGVPDECANPPFMADAYELSVASGGTQSMTLTAPTPLGLYLVLGSTSGTSPGIQSGPWLIPLNYDSYMFHTAVSPNAPPLAGSFGALTPSGDQGIASASFTMPASFDPALVGMTLHHAYVTIGLLSGQVTSVSNPVPLSLVP